MPPCRVAQIERAGRIRIAVRIRDIVVTQTHEPGLAHVALAIHADGGPPTGRGFHVNYSNPPLNTAQAGPSVQLARIMREALAGSGTGAAWLSM